MHTNTSATLKPTSISRFGVRARCFSTLWFLLACSLSFVGGDVVLNNLDLRLDGECVVCFWCVYAVSCRVVLQEELKIPPAFTFTKGSLKEYLFF